MRNKLLTFIALVLAVGGIVFAIDYQSEPTPEASKTTVLPPEPKGPPLDFSGFNPALIISNQNFYRPNTMSASQIQAFLENWGQGCRDGVEKCLKDYRADLPDFPADRYCPSPIAAKPNATASEIIAKVAQSCQINPQVILATLQKEQSLITASSNMLTKKRYDSAMGYSCPDHSACNPQFAGFIRQVYYAAHQFRIYQQKPYQYNYRAGKTSSIKYGPNEKCGAENITIANAATAALYNYTPYIPSEKAKQGQVSACDQRGNLNFYALFKAWFGDPTGAIYDNPRRREEILPPLK